MDNDAKEKEIARRVDEVQNARDSATSSISTQTRTISLGVLAVVWLLLGGTQQSLTAKFECYSNSLIVIAALCVLAIAIDFAQYVFTYIDTSSALEDSLKAKEVDDAGFHDNSKFGMLTNFCFISKICVSGVAALWLILVMFGALTR